MSISPPSDIVSDVAKAADPQAYRAAAEKLARASGGDGAGADFASAAAAVEAAAPQSQAAGTSASTAASLAAPQTAQLTKKKTDAYTQFEAFFLQNFVESMLPKDSAALFGSGTAGDVWRSMLAEHMANELAKSAAFGIAKKLADNRAVKEKAAQDALHPAQSPAAHPARPSAALAPADQDPASRYVASLHKLLAADGRLALTQAPAADALAQTSKGL